MKVIEVFKCNTVMILLVYFLLSFIHIGSLVMKTSKGNAMLIDIICPCLTFNKQN